MNIAFVFRLGAVTPWWRVSCSAFSFSFLLFRRWSSILSTASSAWKVLIRVDHQQYTLRCQSCMVLVRYPFRVPGAAFFVANRGLLVSHCSNCVGLCLESYWLPVRIGLECLPTHGTPVFWLNTFTQQLNLEQSQCFYNGFLMLYHYLGFGQRYLRAHKNLTFISFATLCIVTDQ